MPGKQPTDAEKAEGEDNAVAAPADGEAVAPGADPGDAVSSDFTEASDAELLAWHDSAHITFRAAEAVESANAVWKHAQIVAELAKREVEHPLPPRDTLDNVTEYLQRADKQARVAKSALYYDEITVHFRADVEDEIGEALFNLHKFDEDHEENE